MSGQLIVGISDMKLSKAPGTIITYALGSCIGVSFYDPVAKVGALLHIMLPDSAGKTDNPFKYADTGIVATLKKMEAMGASKARLVVKIAGGAQMFKTPDEGGAGNIGKKNNDKVRMVLMQQRIPIKGADTGGNVARTVELDVTTGITKMRAYGQPDRNL